MIGELQDRAHHSVEVGPDILAERAVWVEFEFFELYTPRDGEILLADDALGFGN